MQQLAPHLPESIGCRDIFLLRFLWFVPRLTLKKGMTGWIVSSLFHFLIGLETESYSLSQSIKSKTKTPPDSLFPALLEAVYFRLICSELLLVRWINFLFNVLLWRSFAEPIRKTLYLEFSKKRESRFSSWSWQNQMLLHSVWTEFE